MREVELGDMVTCKVTGFTGIVIGKTEYLYANSTVAVLPTTLSDGEEPPERQWMDIDRVRLTDEQDGKVGFRKQPNSQ